MASLADRSLELHLRDRRPLRGRGDRGPARARRRGRWRRRRHVFVVTRPRRAWRPGVVDRVRGLLEAAGLDGRRLRGRRAEPGHGVDRARAAPPSRLRDRGHGRRAGRRRLVDGHGQGHLAPRAQRRRRAGARLPPRGPHAGWPDRRRPDDRRDRRRDAHASASSRTRRPDARTTSAIPRSCRSGPSSTRP